MTNPFDIGTFQGRQAAGLMPNLRTGTGVGGTDLTRAQWSQQYGNPAQTFNQQYADYVAGSQYTPQQAQAAQASNQAWLGQKGRFFMGPRQQNAMIGYLNPGQTPQLNSSPGGPGGMPTPQINSTGQGMAQTPQINSTGQGMPPTPQINGSPGGPSGMYAPGGNTSAYQPQNMLLQLLRQGR